MITIKNILVPTDFGEASDAALMYGRELASRFGAELHVLHVADNMYLSLLVETGVAGLAALVWLNLAILRASARAARSSNPQRAFYGTWMLCFWAGETVQMASGDLLTYWRVLPVYFFVLALALRV